MAHNERHQSPTRPSGHPVTNPLLKPSSRFQVTFVTNSSFISRGSGTESGLDRDTLTEGGTAHYPTRTSVLAPRTQPNLQFAIQVSGLPASSRRTSNGFSPPLGEVPPYICFCSPLQDPPLGREGRSGTLLGLYLPNQVSDWRVL